MSVPMTLSDLDGQDAKNQTFPDDIRNYAPTISPTATKIGTMTHVGEGRVSMGSDMPRDPKGRGPASQKF